MSIVIEENPIYVTVTQGDETIVVESGIQGAKGEDGAPGAKGDTGVGIAIGGTTGQSLVKTSGEDYDTEWATRENPLIFSDGILRATNTISLDFVTTTIENTELWSANKTHNSIKEMQTLHGINFGSIDLFNAFCDYLPNPNPDPLAGDFTEIKVDGVINFESIGIILILTSVIKEPDTITPEIYNLKFKGYDMNSSAPAEVQIYMGVPGVLSEDASLSWHTGGFSDYPPYGL